MKTQHEQWIATEAMIPKLPCITLSTRNALQLCELLPEITSEVQAALREQELVIRNPNRIELFNFVLETSLPETFNRGGNHRSPAGPQIRIQPIYPAMTAVVKGNAKVRAGRPAPTFYYRFEIDKVPANVPVYRDANLRRAA